MSFLISFVWDSPSSEERENKQEIQNENIYLQRDLNKQLIPFEFENMEGCCNFLQTLSAKIS